MEIPQIMIAEYSIIKEKKGALVTWADNDGAEDISRSGFYLTDSFDEFEGRVFNRVIKNL